MKKIAPWLVALLILLVVGVVVVLMFKQTIKPSYLGVRDTVNYRGYKVTYKNETRQPN